MLQAFICRKCGRRCIAENREDAERKFGICEKGGKCDFIKE